MCLQQDNNEESKNAKMKSSKIEQDLHEQARSEVNVVKILMLGEMNYGFCVHHKHLLSSDKALQILWLISNSECSCLRVRGCGERQEHSAQTDQDYLRSRLFQTWARQLQGTDFSSQQHFPCCWNYQRPNWIECFIVTFNIVTNVNCEKIRRMKSLLFSL